MKVTNKDIRRFAQTMQKSLNIDISHCIKVVEMLRNNARQADINHYIISNNNCFMVREVEQCLVDVNSDTNIIIGKNIYYSKSDSGHTKGKKIGELKFINDTIYFPYK